MVKMKKNKLFMDEMEYDRIKNLHSLMVEDTRMKHAIFNGLFEAEEGKTLTTFSVQGGQNKQIGTFSILVVDRPDNFGNIIKQYHLVHNGNTVAVFGEKGQVSGPRSARDYQRALGVDEFDYDRVVTEIERKFKEAGLTVTIPRLKAGR